MKISNSDMDPQISSLDNSPLETAMAELDEKIPYFSQIKRALKSAASGKERYCHQYISITVLIMRMSSNFASVIER